MAATDPHSVLFDSKSDGATGVGPVSSEEKSHANPASEIIPAVGAIDTIDRTVYSHWVQTSNLVWTTANAPSHLLWYTPISPLKSNAFIKHLSLMYNTWRGGFDYKFKIAGTGFHAGSLMVVRLPPNIKPLTLSTSASITAFPYMVVDPKLVECVSVSIMDQTSLMYHFTHLDENDPATFGGYIAVYVLQQLSTSSTGADRVTVEVFTKPAADFRFAQLIPPNLGPDPSIKDLGELYLHMDAPYDNITGLTVMDSLNFSNGTSLGDNTVKWNQVGLDGTAPKAEGIPLGPVVPRLNKFYLRSISGAKFTPMYINKTGDLTEFVPTAKEKKLCIKYPRVMGMYDGFDSDFPYMSANTWQFVFDKETDISISSGAAESLTHYRITYDHYFAGLNTAWTDTYPMLTPVHKDDRILLFYNNASTAVSTTQLASLADALMLNPIKLGAGKGLLFSFVNLVSGDTYAYFRLAHNGLLTYNAAIQAHVKKFLGGYKFVYIGEILDTQPIPTTTPTYTPRVVPATAAEANSFRSLLAYVSSLAGSLNLPTTEILAACNLMTKLRGAYHTVHHPTHGPIFAPRTLNYRNFNRFLAIIYALDLLEINPGLDDNAVQLGNNVYARSATGLSNEPLTAPVTRSLFAVNGRSFASACRSHASDC